MATRSSRKKTVHTTLHNNATWQRSVINDFEEKKSNNRVKCKLNRTEWNRSNRDSVRFFKKENTFLTCFEKTKRYNVTNEPEYFPFFCFVLFTCNEGQLRCLYFLVASSHQGITFSVLLGLTGSLTACS